MATAQLTFDSKKELFAKNVISQFDLQTAENNLLTAQAALAQAEAQRVNAANNLSYTEVKSPSDGVVGVLPYRVGALVSASIPQPLTTISDNSEMYVYFSLTENQLLDLTRQFGSMDKAIAALPDVQLQLNDGTMYDKPGRVESISGVIDTSTGHHPASRRIPPIRPSAPQRQFGQHPDAPHLQGRRGHSPGCHL